MYNAHPYFIQKILGKKTTGHYTEHNTVTVVGAVPVPLFPWAVTMAPEVRKDAERRLPTSPAISQSQVFLMALPGKSSHHRSLSFALS